MRPSAERERLSRRAAQVELRRAFEEGEVVARGSDAAERHLPGLEVNAGIVDRFPRHPRQQDGGWEEPRQFIRRRAHQIRGVGQLGPQTAFEQMEGAGRDRVRRGVKTGEDELGSQGTLSS